MIISSSGPEIRQTGRKNSLQGSVNQNLFNFFSHEIFNYIILWIKLGV